MSSDFDPPCNILIYMYRLILMKFRYDVIRVTAQNQPRKSTLRPIWHMTYLLKNFRNSHKLHLWTDLHDAGCKWKILDDTILLYKLCILFMPIVWRHQIIKNSKSIMTSQNLSYGPDHIFFSPEILYHRNSSVVGKWGRLVAFWISLELNRVFHVWKMDI